MMTRAVCPYSKDTTFGNNDLQPNVRSRVVFLPDCDIAIAQELVQGVDLWLNTLRRPWEACGTSGMKVLVNGGPNLSELDGWWAEAHTLEMGLGSGRWSRAHRTWLGCGGGRTITCQWFLQSELSQMNGSIIGTPICILPSC